MIPYLWLRLPETLPPGRRKPLTLAMLGQACRDQVFNPGLVPCAHTRGLRRAARDSSAFCAFSAVFLILAPLPSRFLSLCVVLVGPLVCLSSQVGSLALFAGNRRLWGLALVSFLMQFVQTGVYDVIL
jgi:hypothetical protein